MLPLALLLMAGAVDVGRAFNTAGIIASAARQGARYGMNYPTSSSTIQSRAVAEAAGSGVTLTASQVTISTPSGTTSGNPVTVTVAYPFTPILLNLLGLQSISINRSCTMVIS